MEVEFRWIFESGKMPEQVYLNTFKAATMAVFSANELDKHF